MSNPRVLFICKLRNDFYDAYSPSFGLVNSATFMANALRKKHIDAHVVKAVDGNCIDRLVMEYNPTHVMIEAIWVTPAKMYELMNLKRHHKRHWAIRLHSKIPFIANEGIAFPWMLQYRALQDGFKNFVMAPNAKEITEDLESAFGMKAVYLPNMYAPPKYTQHYPKKVESKECIDIGCFGAIRPMKNQLIQAVAAIKYANDIGKKLKFHMNGSRCEQNGQQVFKNIDALFAGQKDHELVLHHWMPHHEFIRLIRTMDIGMQVSYSESFNIVAADTVDNEVPFVGSPDIDWLPKLYQTNPNSSTEIVSAMHFATGWMGRLMKYTCKKGLAAWNDSAEENWLGYLLYYQS